MNENDMNWLKITSYPEIDKKENEIEIKENKDELEDYIEFDRELFDNRCGISKNLERKYSKNKEKLLRRSKKLIRKAIVELSYSRPMLIDKFDTYKICFIVDLNRKRPFSINNHRINYKVKTKNIMGIYQLESRYTLNDRYYINDLAKKKSVKIQFINNLTVFESKIKLDDFDINMIPIRKDTIMESVSLLNSKLMNNPHDIDSWIKLINLQKDKLGDKLSNLSIFESQMAVLDKALSKNPTSEELLLRKIQLINENKDSSETLKVIDELIFNYPNKIMLWITYIEFYQSDFNLLDQVSIIKNYIKALDRLESLKSTQVRASLHLTNIECSSHQLQLYTSLALFLLNCDLTEKLIYLFQMLIEINLFEEKGTKFERCAVNTKKYILENFSNSNCPRLGDVNYKGLNNFIDEKSPLVYDNNIRENLYNIIKLNNSATNDENINEVEIIKNSKDKTQSWITIESLRSGINILPCNNIDEPDIERISLFEDVSKLLYILDKTYVFDLCVLLLMILGVPIPSKYTHVSKFIKDSLIIDDNILHNQLLFSIFNNIIGTDIIYLQRNISRLWTTIGCENIYQYIPIDCSLINFIRIIFATFISLNKFNDEEKQIFSLMWVNFEILLSTEYLCKNYKFAICITKNLLELPINRSYSFLWIYYVFCLVSDDKFNEFLKITPRLIDSISSSTNHIDYSLFVRIYIEYIIHYNLIEKVNKNDLINIIDNLFIHIFNCEVSSIIHDYSTYLIRMISTSLNDKNDVLYCSNLIICQFFIKLLSCTSIDAINNFISLFEYCRNRCIKSMNKSRCIFNIDTTEYDDKCMIYDLCRRIIDVFSLTIYDRYFNITNYKQFEPLLHTCIQMFPYNYNTHLWLYKNYHHKIIPFSIHVLYNRLMTNSLNTSINITPSIYAIYLYILQYTHHNNYYSSFSTSTLYHNLISICESLIQNPAYRSRPLIWRLYLRILYITGDPTSLSNSVYYRALKSIPYCKEFYKDSIIFGVSNLKDVIDIFIEKGLRLRTTLEELELLSNINT